MLINKPEPLVHFDRYFHFSQDIDSLKYFLFEQMKTRQMGFHCTFPFTEIEILQSSFPEWKACKSNEDIFNNF